MAEISLRSYLKEIESLIELERLDEAIAHCRHVLQIYPKDIDFYRLLGKAYLEARRYGDSSDIFQRVLSADPTDYVAHVAMSVIREDEGNLEMAIWHMERAFETNPANQVIQQELKRLFGIRDSIEPMKIRLTRGALAYMYANGDLYPQAIAELRAALQEDDNRPDLQVLLAEMYWLTNEHLKAAEVCNELLSNLPHCITANRIMAALLQSSGESDASTVYLRRLAALDPYTAFNESPMDDADLVDDEIIMIEKMEWEPGQDISDFIQQKPDWTTSLGEELASEEQPEEAADTWQDVLPTSAIPQAEAADRKQSEPFTQDVSQVDDAIPEWMRNIGWDTAEGETTEEERLSFTDEELENLQRGLLEEDEITPAEIPDWLRDMAPTEIEDEIDYELERESVPGAGGLPGWLKGMTDELRAGSLNLDPVSFPDDETDGVIEEAELEESPIDSEITEGEGKDIPSWLEESEPGASETIIGWLGERATQEETVDSEIPVSETPASEPLREKQDDISWLDGVAEAAAIEQQEDDQKELDRLREISAKAMPSPGEDEPITIIPEEAPTWLREISQQYGEEEEAPPDAQDLVGWQPEFDPSKVTRPLELPPDDVEIPEYDIEDLSAETLETEAPPHVPESVSWQPEFDPSKVTRPLEPLPDDLKVIEPEFVPDQDSIDRLRRLAEAISETEPPEDRLEDFPEAPGWLHEMSLDVSSLGIDEEDETITQKLFREVDRLTKETGLLDGEELEIGETFQEGEIPEPFATEAPSEDEIPGELEPLTTEPAVDAERFLAEVPGDDEISGEWKPVTTEPSTEAEPSFAEIPDEAEIPVELEALEVEAVGEAETLASKTPLDAVVGEQEHPTIPPKPAPSPKLTEKDATSLLQSAWTAARAGDIQTAAQVYGTLVKGRLLVPKVIESLQKALELHPDASIFWKVLGDAHMRADRLPEAMKAYQRGLKRV
jgi:tetratricopeptide (TPR) repeat protein